MKVYLYLWITLLIPVLVSAKEKIKVACVGNSVTYGYLLPEREKNAYPVQLQKLLGENYIVKNFGKSGATLLKMGHRPYTDQPEYQQALDFAAERVVIHLGLNDTDPRNWPHYRDNFIKDYTELIASFKAANPQCKIWICRLTPIGDRHPRFRSGTRDWHAEIQKEIEKIAVHTEVGLIDLEEPLYHRPDLFPDALHPDPEGAGLLAQTVYSALTGDYGGLQLPLLYSDNMILQRNKPLLLSGKADKGEKIRVKIAGQQQTTCSGENGKWEVTFPPFEAGGPYTLEIRTSRQKQIYHNVWIGEVWVCSGQSNMAFPLKQCATAQSAFRQAWQPQIRLFHMQPYEETNAVEWRPSFLDSLNRLQYYRTTGWTETDTATIGDFSAIAYYFGKMLNDSLNVPVGLILNAIGGSPCEAGIDRRTLEYDLPDILQDWKHNDMIQDWVRQRAGQNIRQANRKEQRHPYEPCYLFEAGILPLEHYPIAGIIWYQGESNAHHTELAEQLFPMLVNSWRHYWQSPRLPFYYVQLSSLNRPSWPRFRDSQRRMLQTIPYTGMAVSSDRGDSLDVHPRYKKEIGERLGRWALANNYGKSITPSGPLFRSVRFHNKQAILEFDYGHHLKTSDGQALRCFEIAGPDGLFYPAKAFIEDDRVIVTSPKVTAPCVVRYAWQPFTRANLVNGDNLPASTFRTDL